MWVSFAQKLTEAEFGRLVGRGYDKLLRLSAARR